MGKIRRFSQGSPIVASYLHDLLSKDVNHTDDDMPYLETLSQYSLVIPTESLQAIEDHPFIMDKRVKNSLEDLKVINWCPGTERLIPLSVSKDGNSLCHAVSVALLGVHDQNLQLRQLVRLAMMSREQEFKKRWIRNSKDAVANKVAEHEFKMALEKEWERVVNITSKEGNQSSIRMTNAVYSPLEEIHIFILANILRRPLIVLSDRPITFCTAMDGDGSPSNEVGHSSLYLPILWPASECIKTPILLAYSEYYFAPLVTFGISRSAESSPEVIPLTREDNSMISAQFLLDEESGYQDQLLKDYLQVVDIEATKSGKFTYISSAAKLTLKPLAEMQKMLQEFLASQHVKPEEEQVDSSEPIPPVRVAERRASLFRCGNKLCPLFITNDSTFPYCTECHRRKTEMAKHAKENNDYKVNKSGGRMEVDCETPSCPYSASVNTFPHCQRCHLQRTASQQQAQVQPKKKELSLEEKWHKLAMGIIDEEVVSGFRNETTEVTEAPSMCMPNFYEQDEYMFVNEHRMMPLEKDEEIAIGGVTSTRSINLEDTGRRRSSITGGRSLAIRRMSIEEEEAARPPGDEWQRRVSWVNEPCKKMGCPYFASLRTFPYCNQCASEVQSVGLLPPTRRKVSGTARILPPLTQKE